METKVGIHQLNYNRTSNIKIFQLAKFLISKIYKLYSLSMQPQKEKVLKLLLVRHGETQDNKTRTIAGHMPGKLTEVGKHQAGCIGAYLAKQKRHFDHVYVSDLGRTKETYEGAISTYPQLKNFPVTFTPLARERGGGILEGKPIITWEQNAKKEGMNVRFYKCQGGESWLDVNKRAHKLLQKIILGHLNPSDGKGEVRVLVVTHGGFIMQFLNVMSHIHGEQPKFNNTALNCSMHEFEIVYPNEFYQMKEYVEKQVQMKYILKNFVGHLTPP